MDGNAVTSCDEAHDIVARERVAALCELDHAVLDSVNDDAGALTACGSYGLLRGKLGSLVALHILYAEPLHDLRELYAAVAYRGEEVLKGVAVVLFHIRLEEILKLGFGHMEIVLSELPFESRPALVDIFLAAFALEPGAYLRLCLVGLCDIEPRPAGTVSLDVGREDIYYLARLYLILVGDHLSVRLCAAHLVTHLRVYRVGEVYDGGAHRKGYHIAFGGESENVLGC